MRRARDILAFLAVMLAFCGAVVFVMKDHQLVPGRLGCHLVLDLDSREDCWAEVVSDRIDDHGIPKALRWSDRLDDTQFRKDCHQAMHVVGRKEAKYLTRDEVQKLWDIKPGTCSLGFLHGATEYALSKNPSNFGPLAKSYCEFTGASRATVSGCYHGVGHAIVRARKHRQRDAHECMSLPVSEARSSCATGVYMEMSNTLTVDEQDELCRHAPSTSQFECASNLMNSIAADSGTSDLEAVLRSCVKVRGNTSRRLGCVFGATAFSTELQDAHLCTHARGIPDGAAICVYSIVGSSRDSARNIRSLCSKLKFEQRACAAGYGSHVQMQQHPDDRRQISLECARLDRYAGTCRNSYDMCTVFEALHFPPAGGCLQKSKNI